jgi:hypothetical protein
MSTYKTEHDPANANATPLYNDNILKFWNWFDSVWGCTDWMNWHKSMKAAFGKVKADATFLHYWNDLATGSSAIDCRSFSSDFRDYMSKENLLDSLYSGLGIIAKPIGVSTDIITNVGGGLSGASKALKTTGDVLKVAVPIALVVAIGFGGFWVYKHYIKK